MGRLTRNFLFNSILTVSNYLFPFIVYPYVSRKLGVENVGIINYVDSFINYAMLISMMGITIIGTRSIAQTKGNPRKLNVAFSSLFLLTAIFTIISTTALVTVTYTVEKLAPYKDMLMLGLIKLWGNFLLIDWLYIGLEDFKYITVRTILVKFGFVASVFILIHSASDYVTYWLLLCLMVAVNAAFNCARAFTRIKFKVDFGYLSQHLGSFLILGIYLFLTSMYTTFNVTYLGWKWDDTEVGYYITATKIFKVLLALYTAYSTVVLPRASALLSQGKHEEFFSMVRKSIQGLLLFSIPIATFSIIFSPGLVNLIAGSEFNGSIVPMMIVMPLMFIIGYEQILVVQILTPMSNDAVILFNSFIGATTGLICNILIVPKFAAIGSAIVWIIAEMAVLITAQFFVTKFTKLKFPFLELFKNIMAYVPYAIIGLLLMNYCPLSPIKTMFIGLGILIIYVIAVQRFMLKNVVFGFCADKVCEFKNKLLGR